ncbi:MAG: indolepyruvate ferredoxin oxidoreductase family protein [Acidobacteriota bacterium]|nr:indolepyruvate ferredoxin oxidoreductase family protein [Acidobacteriota bacterium]
MAPRDMNELAALPDRATGLSDYLSRDAQVLHLSGVTAVVRMLVDVLRWDTQAGRATAGFVSGYQGSPLAGLDRELERALLHDLGVEIVHRPAVNEELAVTAVMGSQIAATLSSSRVDGVVGVWYGKAPGLDRSVDALRHASYAGAHSMGGALALVGDDPDAKSSTLPSASEGVLADLAMPVMFPSSLRDILELGQHAVALSRWSGAWTALKLVTSVADAEGTVSVGSPLCPVLPAGYVAPPVTGDLLTPATTARESWVLTDRLDAAARYGDSNQLNRVKVDSPGAVLTIVAAGTTYLETVEALRRLGLHEPDLRRIGIRLAEIRMPFPLGTEFAHAVADGVREVLVIEERRDLIENQLLSLTSRRPGRPTLLGHFDGDNRPLVPRHGSLDAATIAEAIGPLLRSRFGGEVAEAEPRRTRIAVTVEAQRVPWFCSGCPHSSSTVVPEGTLLGEGIGCHSIVHYMPEERVGHSIGITQMGGEGAQWIGMEPFVGDRHIVQNLGDGTFFHSGHLAVRAAVASGVSITYKVLWNGATAMTGGQDITGSLGSPGSLAATLLLEGVRQVVITTDDPSRYRHVRLPRGVTVRPRRDVIEVQSELARVQGVTVMIHDQPCATELRRARKRGLVSSPRYRVVINERVCEGCGDCQTKSNCLSLQTVDTPFGPKTRIDQESCNVDLSCLAGDCPAFSLVATPRGSRHSEADSPGVKSPPVAPPRSTPRPLDRVLGIRIAGIGGTGVVTAAHLLGRAALLEGLEVWGLDQTGMAQKAGPVISDLRIGPGASERSNRLGAGETDLLLAADLLTAVSPTVLDSLSTDRTVLVGSTTSTLSGPMILGTIPRRMPRADLEETLHRSVRAGRATFVDSAEVARTAGAPASTANVALLGVASGLGELPVSETALMRAIELTGIAVPANLAAFRAGRAWTSGCEDAKDQPGGDGPGDRTSEYALPAAYRGHIADLADDLVGYQDQRLAGRFLRLVSEAWEAEERAGGDGQFATAVAFGYHKLLAYKDEYEVARLLLEHPAAEGPTAWLLHPPMLRSLGLDHKLRLGNWSRPALAGLRRARWLRGRKIDPFGYTHLRREERRLPVEYAVAIRSILGSVSCGSLQEATEIALLPDQIRGFEGVKEKAISAYRSAFTTKMEAVADLEATSLPV